MQRPIEPCIGRWSIKCGHFKREISRKPFVSLIGRSSPREFFPKDRLFSCNDGFSQGLISLVRSQIHVHCPEWCYLYERTHFENGLAYAHVGDARIQTLALAELLSLHACPSAQSPWCISYASGLAFFVWINRGTLL